MGSEELPALVSHTPAPPQLRPRDLLTPPTPTGSDGVYHCPEGQKGHEKLATTG